MAIIRRLEVSDLNPVMWESETDLHKEKTLQDPIDEAIIYILGHMVSRVLF